MKARLKALTCSAEDGRLVVSMDPRSRVELDDPDGQVLELLTLLREGVYDLDELVSILRVRRPGISHTEVETALAGLDRLGWLEDADADRLLESAQRERYYSNLAFFDSFTSLSVHREELQTRVRRSRVLVLGVGGLGSSVVQHLVGLGVGELILLDFDVVDTRNFARQFTYTQEQIGRSKAEMVAGWVRAFDPAVQVTALHRRVTGPDTVTALLDGVDVVVSAIDQPPDTVDLWVNEACVGAGVPFVRGGLAYLQGLYWSVDPGRSACRQCLELFREQELQGEGDTHVARWQRPIVQEPINRAIGPIAGMLGALVAMEALRFLSGYAPAIATGTYHLIDFTGACHITTDAWPADPRCPVCRTAPVRIAAEVTGVTT